MGNIITNWAQEQTVGGGVAKAILLCLADHAKDYERGRVSMTIPQIASVIEFSKRAIIDNLEKLKEKNLIVRDKSKKADGTNNPNSYQILCPPEIFENQLGAGDAPSEAETPPEICVDDTQGAPEAPPLVREIHLEQGAGDALSTVLEEEELLTGISLSPRAGAPDVQPEFEVLPNTQKRAISAENLFGLSTEEAEREFTQILIDGLKKRIGAPVVLPDEWKWTKSIEAAWKNSFSAAQSLETYDLLEKIRKKKKAAWTVSPDLWARKIPKIEELRTELEDLENEGVTKENAAIQRNSNGHRETEHDRRKREARERIQFDELADQLLESEGIVQTRGGEVYHPPVVYPDAPEAG